MAITEFPKQIVQVIHLPDAGTCEGEVHVCADGTRWRRSMFTLAGTAHSMGIVRGNRIEHCESS